MTKDEATQIVIDSFLKLLADFAVTTKDKANEISEALAVLGYKTRIKRTDVTYEIVSR